jgi:hypothetical protein
MQRIRDFWSASFHSDPRAFILELISFSVTVVASFLMAFTAAAPDLRIIYPLFFVGSLAGCWAYVRRRLAWPMMLTAYFMIINVFGFGRAMFWW